MSVCAKNGVAEPCHFAYVPVPVPFNRANRILLKSFFSKREDILRYKSNSITTNIRYLHFIFFCSRGTHSFFYCVSQVKITRFFYMPGTGKESIARIRFRFVLGKNYTVLAVPIPEQWL
jgi:hypothetical protein